MAHSTQAHVVVKGLQPVQVPAGLVALVLVLIGAIALVQFHGTVVGATEVSVLGLTLKPLQAWAYLDAGILGLVWALTSVTARAFGWLLLAGGGLLFVWGLMLNGLIAANPLSWLGDPFGLTVADGWRHLVVAVIGLILAVSPAHKTVHLHRGQEAPEPVAEVDTPAPPLLLPFPPVA